MNRAIAVLLGASLVAACSAPSGGRPVYSRTLLEGPGEAQPSYVVARDLAMAKQARAVGEAAAFAEFAAPGADRAAASLDLGMWVPKTVWVSCDGRFAVSEGRFENESGLVGDYVTTWRRGVSSNDYRWLHHVAALDDPQPPPKPPQAPPAPDEIVVDGLVSADGHVADCREKPVGRASATEGGQVMRSPDGTLVWRSGQTDTMRTIEVDAWMEGRWSRVYERRWPVAEEGR